MLKGSRLKIAVIWLFFFSCRRRHTRFDCDWSSDVCSSDLLLDRDAGLARAGGDVVLRQRGDRGAGTDGVDVDVVRGELLSGGARERDHAALAGAVDRVGRAGVALSGDPGAVDDRPALLCDQ